MKVIHKQTNQEFKITSLRIEDNLIWMNCENFKGSHSNPYTTIKWLNDNYYFIKDGKKVRLSKKDI